MMPSSSRNAKTEKEGPFKGRVSNVPGRTWKYSPKKVGLFRNHFYNRAFNDGILLKAAEVRKIAQELHRLVQSRTLTIPDPRRSGDYTGPNERMKYQGPLIINGGPSERR